MVRDSKLRMRNRSVAILLSGLLVFLLISFWSEDSEFNKEGTGPHGGDEIRTGDVSRLLASEAEEKSSHVAWSPATYPGFHPDEVLDNLDCQVTVAGDTALVVLRSEKAGARFAAVGRVGVLHSGELDFLPATFDLAKRSDGSVLMAFGDVERTEPGRPSHDTKWPVHIYLDGQPLIEHENIWQFGLASDGSSYYLVEPLAGDTSRLVIHNLDEGINRSYDLGEMATSSPEGALPFAIHYSLDNSELHLRPTIDGVDTNYFYPVGGEHRSRHEVRVSAQRSEYGLIAQAAVFASSQIGYITYWLPDGDDYFLLTRVERDPDAVDSEAVSRWSRRFRDVDASRWDMTLSEDGNLLLLAGWTVRLLDTATGESVLEMPVVNKEAQLARLASVLAPDAGVEDIGWATGTMGLSNDHLYIGRDFSLERDGFEGRAVDVYDLNGIRVDSPPARRIHYSSDAPPCSPDTPFQRLAERDGQLVFET